MYKSRCLDVRVDQVSTSMYHTMSFTHECWQTQYETVCVLNALFYEQFTVYL